MNTRFANAFRGFIISHKALILILLAGLALRLAFFCAVKPWQPDYITKKIIMVDAQPYHEFALSILNTRSFEQTGSYRTPGYPLFLASVYAVFGVRPWAAILIQVFIGLATILLVYLWTKEWFSKTVALTAAGIFAVEPHVIIYGACLLTETLFVFTLLLSVYLWQLVGRGGKLFWAALSGLLLGYTVLIRPISILLPMLLIPAGLVYAKNRLPGMLKTAGVFALMFVLTVSLWMFKNYNQYGYFDLTHINGFNLYFVSAAYTEVAKTGKTYTEVCAEFESAAKKKGAYETPDQFKQSAIFAGLGAAYLRDNLALYARRHLTGMITLFTNLASTDTTDLAGLDSMQKKYNVYEFHNFIDMIKWYFANKTRTEIVFGVAVSLFLLITYLSAFYGIFRAIKDKYYAAAVLNLTIAFYFVFMTGVFGVARYRLPVIPFYALFSAYGLAFLFAAAKNRLVNRGEK